jgi:hypothetical protein
MNKMECKIVKKMKKQLSYLFIFALVITSISMGFGFKTQALTSMGSWRVYGKTATYDWYNPITWFEGTGDSIVVKFWSGPDGTGTLLYTTADLGDGIKRVAAEGSNTYTDIPTTNKISSITFNKVSGTDNWSCDNLTVYYTPSGGSEQMIASVTPTAEISDDNPHLIGNTTFFNTDHNRYINYNANGGSGTMAPQYLIWGTSDHLSANTFTRNGYTYAGWSATEALADAGILTYPDGFDFMMPDNVVDLWAVWVPLTGIAYTINHYKENISKTAFDILAATETSTGSTGQMVYATDNAYEGFTAVTPLASGAIIYDGSLVVNQYYTRNTYSFNFDANGGTGGGQVTMAYGAPFSAPAVTKAGYILTGWVPALPATVPIGGGSYTAQWSQSGYTITFDAAGGTGGGQQIVDFGVTPTPPTVTRTGYTFAGWSPAIVPATATATYTAQWTLNTYTITFDAAGGVGGGQQTVKAGDMPVVPTVTKAGYTFTRWTPAVTAATANKTYTAHWSVNSYTITFDASGGTGGNVQTLVYGATPAAPAVTRTGYNFTGWQPTVGAVTGDTTYYAQWSIKTYTITFNANGGTGGTVETGNYGEVPNIPDVSRPGYTFAGWFPDIELVSRDITYVAQWQSASTITLTFNANGGEGGGTLYMSAGAALTPPAAIRAGYTFAGWSPSVPATVPAVNTTYTAIWTANSYNAVFMVDSTVYKTVPTVYGKTITLPSAPAKSGYTFAGWDNIPAKMPANDVTINALWNRLPVTLSAKAGSTTIIDQNKGFISGLEEGLTIGTFLSSYVTINGDGRIEYQYYTDSFGSQTRIDLIDNVTGLVVKSYYIVIYGDVDGDGYVTAADENILGMVASYQMTLDEGSAFAYAGDLTQDEQVDTFDLNLVSAATNYSGTISQTNPSILV